LALLALSLLGAPAASGKEPGVAMNVQNSPKAQLRWYSTKKSTTLQPMSRLRTDDQIILEAEQSVTLVFHVNGRIERWIGPGKIRLNADKATSTTATVQIFASDPAVGESFLTLPILLRLATLDRGDRIGTTQDPYNPPVHIDDAERAQIAAAVEMATKLRAELPGDAIVPELLRALVSANYAQYPECVAAFSEAGKRCPECPHLSLMQAWCAEHAAER